MEVKHEPQRVGAVRYREADCRNLLLLGCRRRVLDLRLSLLLLCTLEA